MSKNPYLIHNLSLRSILGRGTNRNPVMLLIFAGAVLVGNFAYAQENRPLTNGRFAIAGYGDVTYTDTDSATSAFNTRLAPIFLFQLNDQMHIETELEYTLASDGSAGTELEYADLHYYLNDAITITAGKFLLPFAQFGPNLHPSWVNRLPSMPGIYGGHHGTGLLEGLMPILSDVGVAAQYTHKFSNNMKLFLDMYTVNGVGEEPPADHDAIPAEDHAEEGHDELTPELNFESSGEDNNNDKAFGARIAVAFLPNWEAGYSYYRSTYDDAEKLDHEISAVDLNWTSTYITVRGEYIRTETDYFNEIADEHDLGEEHDADSAAIFKDRFDRDGWYLQGSWQLRQFSKDFLNPVELVVRYSEINKAEAGEQWSYGLNYWMSSSATLKLAYEDTELADGREDTRVYAQLSFGF